MEERLRHSLYKIELYLIKIIPALIAGLTLLSTLLSYINIDTSIISYIVAILVWLFLYISSFVFGFCIYHRLLLYYILIINIINYIDYTYEIPLGLRDMIALHIGIIGIFIFIALYFHKYDKHARKEDVG